MILFDEMKMEKLKSNYLCDLLEIILVWAVKMTSISDDTYDMKYINEIYDLHMKIIPFTSEKQDAKLLSSIFPPLLKIPPIFEQIQEQKLFYETVALRQ